MDQLLYCKITNPAAGPHNVRPVSSVDAADDDRCLQYSAIARGSAFSQSPNSVLGRRPRPLLHRRSLCN
eukprot:6922603-Prymnesium_polylepis.1